MILQTDAGENAQLWSTVSMCNAACVCHVCMLVQTWRCSVLISCICVVCCQLLISTSWHKPWLTGRTCPSPVNTEVSDLWHWRSSVGQLSIWDPAWDVHSHSITSVVIYSLSGPGCQYMCPSSILLIVFALLTLLRQTAMNTFILNYKDELFVDTVRILLLYFNNYSHDSWILLLWSLNF